jgi:hypothetical protein
MSAERHQRVNCAMPRLSIICAICSCSWAMLDKLRRIDLDHPDTQKAIELIKFAFDSTRRPGPSG